MADTRALRVRQANQLLAVIAGCGRRFFSHEGRVARLELDHRKRIWWIDHYTQRRVYTHRRGEWRGFTSGGTLRNLVERLRDYIRDGKRLNPALLGPWPAWVCDGDLWAYGDDMEIVRAEARRLGILAEPKPTFEEAQARASSPPPEPPQPESGEEGEEEVLLGCQRLGTACGLDFDEEDATLHLRRDDGSEPLEGGRTRLALCGTRVGWDASGGVMNRAPRCGRCFELAAAEGFGEATAAESGEEG